MNVIKKKKKKKKKMISKHVMNSIINLSTNFRKYNYVMVKD